MDDEKRRLLSLHHEFFPALWFLSLPEMQASWKGIISLQICTGAPVQSSGFLSDWVLPPEICPSWPWPSGSSPSHSDLYFTQHRKGRRRVLDVCWDPAAPPANSVSKMLHPCHWTTLLLPYFILFWVTTDNCSEIQKNRLWCWAATSDRVKTSGPRFCRIKEAVHHSLAELHPKIPLISAKPITQTSFSPCYFAPADSSCLDKGNYTLRDWYFKKEWGPWLNDFWKATFVFKDNVQMIGKGEVGPLSYTRKFDSLGMLLVHLHLRWWGWSTNLSSTTQVLSPKVGESYASVRIDNKSELLFFSKKRNKHSHSFKDTSRLKNNLY